MEKIDCHALKSKILTLAMTEQITQNVANKANVVSSANGEKNADKKRRRKIARIRHNAFLKYKKLPNDFDKIFFEKLFL
ncbi:hypothetical protein [Helicobacter sp. T3_23-1056]